MAHICSLAAGTEASLSTYDVEERQVKAEKEVLKLTAQPPSQRLRHNSSTSFLSEARR